MKKEKPETKLCRHCKTEIPYGAKVCPNCKKKQGRPIIPVVIAAVVILIIIAAASSGGDDGPKKVDDATDGNSQSVNASGNTAASGSVTDAANTDAASTDAETDAKTTFGVGEIAEMNDIRVTLVGVTESEGREFFKPDDGKVYLICEFEIENRSDKDISVSSIMSFEAYVDDYSMSMDFTATASADKPQLDGSVAAGKKMNGVIGYEVGADWSEIEIHFTADFWSDKDFVFTAHNDG